MQGSDISTLRVFMTTLRKKIEPSAAAQRLIQTHIGIGYCMNRIA
ncbi:MAG: helix-turn-helix domain-containing protein [Clostridia bacterium]